MYDTYCVPDSVLDPMGKGGINDTVLPISG